MKYRSSFAALVFAALPAALLLSTNPAHAESGSAAASSFLDFHLSFSDSLSHVDQDSTYTIWIGSTGSVNDPLEFYASASRGALSDQYTASQNALNASSTTNLNLFGGTLKSEATASSFVPDDTVSVDSSHSLDCNQRPVCMSAVSGYQTRLVLMPGATLTLSGSYGIQGAFSAGSNEAASASTIAGYAIYGDLNYEEEISIMDKRSDVTAADPSYSLGGEFLVSYTNTTGEAKELPVFMTATAIAGGIQTAVAPVPEPQTWAMFLAGLAGLAPLVRRRRAKAALTT